MEVAYCSEVMGQEEDSSVSDRSLNMPSMRLSAIDMAVELQGERKWDYFTANWESCPFMIQGTGGNQFDLLPPIQ